MILPRVRDPRLITVRRGGSLSDEDHHALALWAAWCAERVLPLFEEPYADDPRPRDALEHLRGWVRCEVSMMRSRAAGGHAMGAVRHTSGAPRFAAYAAGQAACVPHVAEHDLGAAAYALKAVRVSAERAGRDGVSALRDERRAQRDALPAAVRALVLEDQERRDAICWGVFGV